jgi:hypothetical protein
MDHLTVNARLRFNRNSVIHVRRYLPQDQVKIFVQERQEVSPADIIGEGQVTAGFRTIYLANELNVSPKEAVKFLKRPLGQKIFQGELLAAKEGVLGFGKKILTSPADGIIDYYDDNKGSLRIKLLPKVTKLASGVYGIIDQVNPETGEVVIRTLANTVYGVIGSGHSREGILKVVGSPDTLISSKQITGEMKEEILVGGSLVFLDALEKAVNLKVSGIISGGISARDFRAMSGGRWNISDFHWSDVGISLMVTEGFGSIPLPPDVFALLKEFDKKFVILDGNRAKLILPISDANSMIYIRKVRLPVSPTPELETTIDLVHLKPGANIRLVATPLIGVCGKVESVDSSPTELPSGVVTNLVTVITRSRKLKVPYQNLEVVI